MLAITITPDGCEGVTVPRVDYTVREMEADDWASLNDQELLERRISKLGTTVEWLIRC